MSHAPYDARTAEAERLGSHAVGLLHGRRRPRSASSAGNPRHGAESFLADLVRMAHATITEPKSVPAAARDCKRCHLNILDAWNTGSVSAVLWRQSHDEDKVAAGQANKVGEARRCAPNVIPMGDEVVESSEVAR